MASHDDFASSDSSNYDFSSDPMGALGGSGSPADISASQFQNMLVQEQQRAAVQEAISRLTSIAFDKCIGRPDSSLSSKESNCIRNVAERYIDSSFFVLNRLSKLQGSSNQSF